MAIDHETQTNADGRVSSESENGQLPEQPPAPSKAKRAAKILRVGITSAAVGLTAAAIAKELKQPKSERTWHGRIAKVPYDFRRPSFSRAKKSVWNPDDGRLFTERSYGLGWAINFARAKELLGQARSRGLAETVDLERAREVVRGDIEKAREAVRNVDLERAREIARADLEKAREIARADVEIAKHAAESAKGLASRIFERAKRRALSRAA